MINELPAPSLTPWNANGVPVLTDQDLFDACRVRVAFTSRAGGFSEGAYESLNLGGHVDDDTACVVANRGRVLGALGATGLPLVSPRQVHGTDVMRVPGTDLETLTAVAHYAQAGADAVVADVPGVAALLCFADCLPLVLVAPDGRFAVVHAGWRGALAGVAGCAARVLADAPNGPLDPAGFNAYIGPYIHSECFETSPDVVAQFTDKYGSGVVAECGNVDLSRAVVEDLRRAGMDPSRVADAGVCTVCSNDAYFSYRAQGGTCGRQGAIAFARPMAEF